MLNAGQQLVTEHVLQPSSKHAIDSWQAMFLLSALLRRSQASCMWAKRYAQQSTAAFP